ncbi:MULTISPECIES: hypothetical protein [Sphingomonas]|uniref:hypothetical protein n=1 Tax=Sphingomonas TaxID=13687 RepID=UPI000DEEFBDE|nr:MULTISPECIES: hypothetical protein [Sphingomonas]
MNKLIMTATLAASIGLAGCATNDPYGYGYNRPSSANGALTGAAVGAATGAVVGAVVPGVSVGAGAVAGGIAGAVIGAVVNGRQTYRTTTGRCFYTDQYGQVVYLPDNQC